MASSLLLVYIVALCLLSEPTPVAGGTAQWLSPDDFMVLNGLYFVVRDGRYITKIPANAFENMTEIKASPK